MYDIAIIGAGIIGSMLARQLSHTQASILLLEKTADVGSGATMANSAIIHSGWDPEEGTLKAELNVEGSRMFKLLCRELGVSYSQCSAFLAATSGEEETVLRERVARAKTRGVPAEILSREEAVRAEPNLSDHVTLVAELPTTAIVNPWELAIACAEEAVLNGVTLLLNAEVKRITREENSAGGFFYIKTIQGTFEARIVINCAGVYADMLAEKAEGKKSFSITPRRGEYFVIDKLKKPVVSRVMYPVPSSVGKGVLAVPTVDGNLLVGPNALDISDREGVNTTAEGLEFVLNRAGQLVKNIPMDKIIRQFAGLRAKGNNGDFYIRESDTIPALIHVACIDSPGLSSAPAIARYVSETILPRYIKLIPKEEIKHRRPTLRLDHMDPGEKARLIASDPSFSNMICRCEQISEGEILDAIRRPAGARTVKGVKKRARPGMGRCQGGFCEPRVVEILARELKVKPTDVTYDGEKSYLFSRRSGEIKSDLGYDEQEEQDEISLAEEELWKGD
jgi:glycerol-3-phosphate dehydrogenase